jgi:hypothetical protein
MRPVVAPAANTLVEPGPPPTFSVIIATYQAAAHAPRAIESALSQTYPPYEVLVVDDGSTDDIERAVAPYRNSVGFRRFSHRGVAPTKNAGVETASGDFIVFLDADDAFLPGRLEAMGELGAARPDLDILATDTYFELDGRRVGRYYDRNAFPTERQRVRMLEHSFLLAHGAIRRERYLAEGGLDEALEVGSDWELWIRLLLGGARAGLVAEPLAVYSLHDASLTAPRVQTLRWRVTALVKTLRDPRLRPEERPVLERSLAYHRRRAALAEAEETLREHPADARKALAPIALGSGFGLRTRVKAALSALAPRMAARRLEERERRSGASRLKRSLPEAR